MIVVKRLYSFAYRVHARIQCGTGGTDPLKNHKNIEFRSNTGTDSLKITKLPKQHSMLGHHWPASKTHLNGVSLADPVMARFYC